MNALRLALSVPIYKCSRWNIACNSIEYDEFAKIMNIANTMPNPRFGYYDDLWCSMLVLYLMSSVCYYDVSNAM